MIKVTSKFVINKLRMKELSAAAQKSLEQTAEALHTEVVQAQVIPRDTGNLQGEAFSVDRKDSHRGTVRLVHSAPYARRVYFNPEGMKFHRQAWKSTEIVTGKNGKKRKKTVKHDGNPNARDHWFEPWLPGGEKADFCAEKFKRFYRRNAKLK